MYYHYQQKSVKTTRDGAILVLKTVLEQGFGWEILSVAEGARNPWYEKNGSGRAQNSRGECVRGSKCNHRKMRTVVVSAVCARVMSTCTMLTQRAVIIRPAWCGVVRCFLRIVCNH